MKRTPLLPLYFTFFLILFANCTDKSSLQNVNLSIKDLASPASEGASEPRLFAAANGKVYLSWMQARDTKKNGLLFSAFENNSWKPAKKIVQGENWFVNWADFPSIAAYNDNGLAVHWLQKSGPGTYAYDVNIKQSADGGNTWSETLVPHDDGTQTEHGFVSMFPWDDTKMFAAWLDGRNMAGGAGHGGQGDMTLRSALIDRKGNLSNEMLLDQRVCECCTTSGVRTPSGALIVFRNRSENELRDISIVRFFDDKVSEPKVIHEDGWQIKACPVNGPAIDAVGEKVAVAWYTAAHNEQRVKVVFSDDEGKHFGEPIIVDDGRPVGRVDVVMLQNGTAMVSWISFDGEKAEIRMKQVNPDGDIGNTIIVAETTVGRSSGFPQMVRSGDRLFFAWTHAEEPFTVRTAFADLAK